MLLLLIFLISWTQEILGTQNHPQMREERAFSGKYLYETKEGIYVCAACENPLFSSQDKYDSGSGWPSFMKPVTPKAVYYLEDSNLPFNRYVVLCRGCDSHLGHVFHDGPPPKNLRYCIHSITLILKDPEGEKNE